MLRTRLWMGAILIGLTVGVLVIDQWLSPWYPFLFLMILVLAVPGCYELLKLLPKVGQPIPWLGFAAVFAMLTINWLPWLLAESGSAQGRVEPWAWIAVGFTAVLLLTFLVEMTVFQEPGQSVLRIALTVWMAAYLGLLPSFLVQLRWLRPPEGIDPSAYTTRALLLAIFVPKCGDIGAYFTGRFLGRHRMSPILSPKKTWEGAFGGMVGAGLGALALDRIGSSPMIRGGVLGAVGLGMALGIAGMLGDLAESLIKRDAQRKDASQVMPGFGGVLDVVDSILFAAPVAYWWLK
jgi:phosphatidate cytidylyltransferase